MMDNRFASLASLAGKRAPRAFSKTMVYLLCLTLVLTGVLPPGAARAQDNSLFSLKEVPVPVPTASVTLNRPPGPAKNLNFQPLGTQIVKSQAALVRLGKALFWDMQVGSDGLMACASCHFNAGGDIRSKNTVSPGLADTNWHNPVLNPLGGDNSFGNSTVPFTANDPLTPNPPGPSEPPPAGLNVEGWSQFRPNAQLDDTVFPINDWGTPTRFVPRGFEHEQDITSAPAVTLQEEMADVIRDSNDVIGSQGVRNTQFVQINAGNALDEGTPLADIFNVLAPGQLDTNSRVRRVTGRNAPTPINAVFNFDNFWDGRASFIFNGVNPFGFRDRNSTLKRNVIVNGVPTLKNVFLRVTNSSLASQAVGPPLSDFEMSWAGRSFPDLGKKMMTLRPLAKQLVHPEDSALGPWSKATLDGTGNAVGNKGVNIPSYANMIRDAFKDSWWNSPEIITVAVGSSSVQKASVNDPRTQVVDLGKATVTKRQVTAAGLPAPLAPNQYTQMEYNFSMFWGLAVQAYEATLVSDDTPFDRFMGAPSKNIPPDVTALTAQEQLGFNIFMSDIGKCNNCHSAPIFTNHSVLEIKPNAQGAPADIVEFMGMGDGGSANYDKGMYNISVRRTTEDFGRAGTAPNAPPFLNPLDGNKPFPLSYVKLASLNILGKLPGDVARFIQRVPVFSRQNVNGNFKVPILRNVEFNGPYFHNGDSATLRQVVEFYVRGGNFPNTNFGDLDPDIEGIPELRNPETVPNAQENIEALVAFISNGLTDERVKFEKGVFDHPQLLVPNGAPDLAPQDDLFLEIPAVGKNGRATPIPRFLDLDPQAF